MAILADAHYFRCRLTCAPFELYCVNVAMQCGDALVVLPAYLALGMVSQLLTGAVFFREFQDFGSAAQAVGFSFSVLLTVTCVIRMSQAATTKTANTPLLGD